MRLSTMTLALLGSAASLAIAAAAQAGGLKSVEWIGSPAPSTPAEMSQMHTAAAVRATYDDGAVVESPLGYDMVLTNRMKVGDNAMETAALYDDHMRPIPDPTTPGAHLVSEEPDGSMLAIIGGKLFLVNHFEYDWLLADGTKTFRHPGWAFKHANGKADTWAWNLPTTVAVTEMSQDAETGKLTPVAQQPVNFGPVNGLVFACNANETPWGTFLSSEENYSVDARQVEADRAADPSGRSDSLAGVTMLYHGGRKLASPYWRGIAPEVTINPDGSSSVVKHFAMGRGTFELAYVMPDQRTVLTAHDGSNKPITLFIADRAGDLSEGTLYAGKFDQKSADHGGTFDVSWVKLGHATDDEIEALADGGIQFSDIYDVSKEAAPGFTEVFSGSEKRSEFLKARNETAAAFLETMRQAGVMGASVEFRKAEGLAFDPEGMVAYLAISSIDRGMLEGKSSGAAGDQIRLAKVKAGAVYALPVAGGRMDAAGAAIDSGYVPVSMHVPQGLLGADLAEPDALGNTADPDKLGNPDNLHWSSLYNTLFVGEDSGMHTTNFLWAWQPGMTAPVRLLSAPAGAELTGLRVHEDIGGHAYALTNAQHVGDFKPGDNAMLKETMKLIRAQWENRMLSPLGHVTGLPAPRN